MRLPNETMWRSAANWASMRTGCALGGRAGRRRVAGWRTGAGKGASPLFPPRAVATVEALACALPTQREEALSRYSTADLTRLIAAHPEAPPMSASTIWRLLDQDALKPWRHHRWRYPRDPRFAEQAGRVPDLYAGWWGGQPLAPDDRLLSADEQTSIQARVRRHPTTPPRPGQAMRVEHEYERGGAVAYLAARDVRRGGVIGRGAATTGIVAFGQLVAQVMRQEPYRAAPRVFWIVDNGSSHRGDAACQRLQARYPNRIPVQLPTQASWLDQIEIFFSIVQRKVLTPNDFPDLAAVERRLLAFEALYNDTAVPFHWRFTRADLEARLAALPDLSPPPIPEASDVRLAA